MKTCTPGQAVVDALIAEGVEVVYGLPGGHILGIYDAIYRTDGIRHILVRHEHAAAAMAAGQAQLTGRPGVCLVTAGPGATNLLTAVAEAHVGALPMVVLAARAVTANAHRGASQEIDTDEVFRPVTKWSVRVDRREHLPEVVRQAFRIATTGKPGPVYVDIPKDMLDGEITVPQLPVPVVGRRPEGDPELVAAVAAQLRRAERPLLIAGGGTVASGAFEELRALAERLSAPVLTSLSGRGSIAEDHPLAAGGLGMHRNELSARLLADADFVLALGTRFEEMETNWRPGYVPSPGVPIAQVDLDGSEFGKSVATTYGIVGDVRAVLAQLLAHVPASAPDTGDPVRGEIAAALARIEAEIDEADAATDGLLNPAVVIREARRVFPRSASLAVDVGCLAQGIAGAFPYFRVYEPRSVIVPTSFYGMGFAAAAAPVARVVRPDEPAICFVGDGSFQMVLPVLASAAENRLGVTWCVLDDNALGSIKDLQEYRFDERYLATDFAINPDFGAMALAAGCHGERVEQPDGIRPALERALAANRDGLPAVLDFRVFPLRIKASRDHFNLYRPEAARA